MCILDSNERGWGGGQFKTVTKLSNALTFSIAGQWKYFGFLCIQGVYFPKLSLI